MSCAGVSEMEAQGVRRHIKLTERVLEAWAKFTGRLRRLFAADKDEVGCKPGQQKHEHNTTSDDPDCAFLAEFVVGV